MESSDLPRLSRLTAILTFLQSKRLITAADIATKFNISKRTAYRDIKALEDSGIPIFTEEGKGYSLLDGYNLPPVMFNELEANALITAEKLIANNKDASLIKNHGSAIEKVKAVLKYSNKDKAELLASRVAIFQNFRKNVTSDNLSTIQTAITHQQLMYIEYLSLGKNEASQRTIEPQAIYHSKENWILIAWCQLRKDYREFRLDKISKLNVLTEEYADRKFDLLGYFQSVMLRSKKKNK